MKALERCMRYLRRLDINFLWICKSAIVITLAVMMVAHWMYYLFIFVTPATTIETTADFYGEHEGIKLPLFQLCFSKLFTYNMLQRRDIRQLFESFDAGQQIGLNNHSHAKFPPYKWIGSLIDTIVRVQFNGNYFAVADIFEPDTRLSTETCYRTRKSLNFKAFMPGQINTFDLIINIASYNDIILNYIAPFTFLSIAPYILDDHPDPSNAIHISPGRFSSIGFELSKFDSTVRSSRDRQVCDRDKSKQLCLITQHAHLLQKKCKINLGLQNFSSTHYFACAVQPDVFPDKNYCRAEICVKHRFRFTKSEAKIKFDKRLSVLNLTSSDIRRIRNGVDYAIQTESQLSSSVRRSFLEMSDRMDVLTDQIVAHFQQITGFKCDGLNNITVNPKIIFLPSLVAEQEEIYRKHNQLTKANERFQQQIKEALAPVMSLRLTPKFQTSSASVMFFDMKNVFGAGNFDNHAPTIQRARIAAVHISLVAFGNSIRKIFHSVRLMRLHAADIVLNYQHLPFLKWIGQYSSCTGMETFRDNIARARLATLRIETQLLHGDRNITRRFAHEDEMIKIPLWYNGSTRWYQALRPSYDNAVGDGYYHGIWSFESWGWHKFYGDEVNNGNSFEVIKAGSSPRVRIPAAIYFYCIFYVNWVGLAEAQFGLEPTFSMGETPPKHEIMQEIPLFILSEIFMAYDTATAVKMELDGISGSVRRSCMRMAGYPYYVEQTATYGDILEHHRMFRRHVLGDVSFQPEGKTSVPERTQAIVEFLADYTNKFKEYKSKSSQFLKYYMGLTQYVNSIIYHVQSFKELYHKFLKFKKMNQNHKRFLVGRLQTFGNLVRQARNGKGEKDISVFLTERGKTLMDEMQLEMMRLKSQSYNDKLLYWESKEAINRIWNMLKSGSFQTSVTQASLTTIFIQDVQLQRLVLLAIQTCNNEKWDQSKAYVEKSTSDILKWHRNITYMIRRAKRFTAQLNITKEFMTENMMHVSLFFNSLTVINQTNARLMTPKQLFSNFGNVSAIYLDLSMFSVLQLICFIIASFMTWLNFGLAIGSLGC